MIKDATHLNVVWVATYTIGLLANGSWQIPCRKECATEEMKSPDLLFDPKEKEDNSKHNSNGSPFSN